MNRDGAYAWEKLIVGMTILAAGQKDLRDRLFDAWMYSVALAFHRNNWPNEAVYANFCELKEDLEFLGPLKDGLAKLPDDDVAEFAKRIVSLNDRVARAMGTN